MKCTTFLHCGWWGLGLGQEVVGEESSQDVVLGVEGVVNVWAGKLGVHLLKMGTKPEGYSCLFRRLQGLVEKKTKNIAS